MENTPHKGTELNNVKETWDQNERNAENTSGSDESQTSTPSNELEQKVKEEATEYDNSNKEDRLLDGDRATVNDQGQD
jgi:hypothetical protein